MTSDQSLEALLRSRLANFRLGEAAGICDAIAATAGEGELRSGAWWRTLSTLARNYRTALLSEAAATVDELMLGLSHGDGPEFDDLAGEARRVIAEVAHWREAVESGEAYIAFLQGYAGVAETDSRLGSMHLARALQITDRSVPLSAQLRNCVRRLDGDLPPVQHQGHEAPMSFYDAFQATADYLRGFFDLPAHPFTDVQRFAVLPDILREAA